MSGPIPFRAIPFLLAVATSASGATAAQAQSEDPAGAESPLLVARADGGWTVTREIRERPSSLALATRGLLLQEPDPATDEERDARAQLRVLETEEAARRVLEEAIDFGREFEGPDGGD